MLLKKWLPVPALTIPLPVPVLSIPLPVPAPAIPLPVPVLTIPFPVNKFPKKLAPRVPYNILKNPPFCFFVSFIIALVTPFSKIFESSSAWTTLIISFISSFDSIKVVVPDLNIFLCVPTSAADADAVNPKGIKKLLAKDLITFFINGNPVFSDVPSNLPRNPPD